MKQAASQGVSAAAPPVIPPPPKPSIKWEEVVGTNWAPKLGVVILFMGLISFIASQWESIPPVGRVGLFYAFGGLLLGGGIWFEKKERYAVLGRSLIGGGWATIFFTTYAMHHVPAAKVISSLEVDLFLMLAVAGVMVWHTLKYNSQLVTGLAFMLGFVSVAQSHTSPLSLLAGVILAVGMTVIVLKRQWYELEVFGILASFLNHFYWLMPIVEGMHRQFGRNVAFPEFPISVSVLMLYWATFRTSYVLRTIKTVEQETVSTVSALLDTILLLAVMKYQSARPELAFYALLALGAIEFSLGQISRIRSRRTAFVVLSSMGAVLMLGAVPFKFAVGSAQMSLLWLMGAQAFFFAGIATREQLFRRFGMWIGILVAVHEIAAQGIPFAMVMVQRAWDGAPPIAVRDMFRLGIVLGVTALTFYVNSHYAGRRWRELFTDSLDQNTLKVLSYLGGAALFFATFTFVPAIWVCTVMAGVALLLAASANRWDVRELMHQTHFFAIASVIDGLIVHADNNTRTRPIAFGIVIVALYAASRFVRLAPFVKSSTTALRGAQFYTWMAAFLTSVLIWHQGAEAQRGILWVALGLVLAVIGRKLERAEFAWQAMALSAWSFLYAMYVNMDSTVLIPGTQRHASLIAVPLIAGGIYALTHWSPTKDMRFVYPWGGTILLATLAYKESPEAWLAAFWTAIAIGVTLAARNRKMKSLLWQSHLLAVLAVARVIYVNFVESYRYSRTQLLSVLAVVAGMYLLTRLTKIPELLEDYHIPQMYSWGGSLMLTWLMWYQLRPINVAVAWAVFGLVMFELGMTKNEGYLRWQSYVALVASFTRIFFVNLNAVGDPGSISPRVITIVPLIAAYFYVYWRITARPTEESELGDSRILTLGQVMAYLGTAAIVALIRWELKPEWVVAAWSLLVVGLAVAAWTWKKDVFLHHAYIVLGFVAARAITYNMLAESFTPDLRYKTVGVAVFLCLCALPLGFLLRDKDEDANALARALARPEQIFFFVPIAMLTILLFVQMSKGNLTLAWGVEGITIFVLALLAKERSFRLTGLGLLMVCVLKILIIDFWSFGTRERYITLIGLGLILITVGFLYGKYKEKIHQELL